MVGVFGPILRQLAATADTARGALGRALRTDVPYEVDGVEVPELAVSVALEDTDLGRRVQRLAVPLLDFLGLLLASAPPLLVAPAFVVGALVGVLAFHLAGHAAPALAEGRPWAAFFRPEHFPPNLQELVRKVNVFLCF